MLISLVLVLLACVGGARTECTPRSLSTSDRFVAPWLPYCPTTCAPDADVCVAADTKISARDPEHSVVMNVRRGAFFVPSVITSLLTRTVGPWELILVFDEPDTDSQAYAHTALRAELGAYVETDLVRCRILVRRRRGGEVRAINTGLRAASPFADVVYIVKDTFLARERGWNVDLQSPIRRFEDVWAVGAQPAPRPGEAFREETVSTSPAVAFDALYLSRFGLLSERSWGVVDAIDDILQSAYKLDGLKSGTVDLPFGEFRSTAASPVWRRWKARALRATDTTAFLAYDDKSTDFWALFKPWDFSPRENLTEPRHHLALVE